jgi:hypothetical protein
VLCLYPWLQGSGKTQLATNHLLMDEVEAQAAHA